MRQWKLCLVLITCLYLPLFAIVAACSQTPASIESPQPVSQKPAEFEVGLINLEPPVVMVGDTVTITASINNVGGIAGTYTAILSSDGQQVDDKVVTLIPEQSSVVEFTISEFTAGKHTISIGRSQISVDVLPKPTKIALVRNDGIYYGWEIYTMDSSSMNLINVTKTSSEDLCPTWSPDGTKIAFQSTREPHNLSSIYLMDADGTNVKCLTPEAKICRFPAWSPDGKKIAYCVMRRPGSSSWSGGGMKTTAMAAAQVMPDVILTMNPDGTAKQYAATGWGPAWFPDSQRIAFTSNSSGIWEIYSVNSYGSDIKKHSSLFKARSDYGTSLPLCEFPALAVSPDGGSIAVEYPDNTPGGGRDIFVLMLNSDKPINITNKFDGASYCPSWSPDGTKIAFTLETMTGTGIYLMNADGSNLTKLINNGIWPTWQR